MYMGKQKIIILYQDPYLCICKKPAGIPCESAKVSQQDMVKLLKRQYFLQNSGGGEPYLALVHRLDQPVGGIMVFAKDPQAAAGLSSQIRSHRMIKRYLAVVELHGKTERFGHLEDYLIRDGRTNTSKVVTSNTKGAKLAVLDYEMLGQREHTALVKITLKTGRHHQIRVQMAAHDMPIVCDRKYNPADQKGSEEGNLALYAYSLAFFHPMTKEFMEFMDMPLEKPFTEWSDFMEKEKTDNRKFDFYTHDR